MRNVPILVTLVAAAVLVVSGYAGKAVADDSVILDHVVGLAYSGAIMADKPVVFVFRFDIESGNVVAGTLGYTIYSPDSAQWVGTSISDIRLSQFWDLGVPENNTNVDGISPDTVSIGGFSLAKPGIPVGYDSTLYQVSLTIPLTEAGKTICIDSCIYVTGSPTSWGTSTAPLVYPAWGGPYCFEGVPCCTGIRGNINLTGGIDISDLNFIVKYLFRDGPSSPCVEEANVDGEGMAPVNIADLTYLVNYLFKAGPQPVACP